MTEEQIFGKVREIAADQLEVDQDDIKLIDIQHQG